MTESPLPPEEARSPSPGRRARSLARRWGPWLLAFTILGVLFSRIPVGEAWTAAKTATLRHFVPATLLGVLAWFWLESTAFVYLFSRFNAPLSGREARMLRGVTYLLTPINWNVGTGAIVLYLRRAKGVPVLEATSSLVFYGLVDGLVLAALALGGSLALPAHPATSAIGRTAAGMLVMEVALLFVLASGRPRWRPLERLRRLRIFHTPRRATARDLAVLFAIRTAYFGGFVLFFWVGTHAFAVRVPLAHLAAAVPALLMIGAMPITPGGLGSQQAAMLYFFGPYGRPAAILAYGFAFPIALMLARLPVGLLYVAELRRRTVPLAERA